MSSLLDRYGNLPVPEEKTRLAVIENPVDVANAAFHLWKQTADAYPVNYKDWQLDSIYDEAVSCLSPHAEAFKDVKDGELEAIISETIPHKHSGLFLSALLNSTDLQMLNCMFPVKNFYLGYKLAPGKFLVAEKGSECIMLGYRAAGGVLANLGTAYSFAQLASGGTQVNYATAEDMAIGVTGGNQINFENVIAVGSDVGIVRAFAEEASGGFQANYYGIMGDFAWNATGGLHIAYGSNGLFGPYPQSVEENVIMVRERGNRPIGSYEHDGQRIVRIYRNRGRIHIEDRICARWEEPQNVFWTEGQPHVANPLAFGGVIGLALPLQSAVDELGEQLKVVEALGRGDSKSVAQAISGYDWNGFEQMVINSSAKISQLAKGVKN